jgi:methionine synthase I (cobalamin-dependent)
VRELAGEYTATDIPEVLLQGFIGPRGDAYQRSRAITEDEAEDYHSVQLATLKEADVDLAWAFTFDNVPESVGVARAAAKIGVPLAISLIVDDTSKLKSGPSIAAAIEGTSQKSCGVLRQLGPQVQWVHSYVTDDKIYCVYIAPDEAAVRTHAEMGGFPATFISEIRSVIDPTTAE